MQKLLQGKKSNKKSFTFKIMIGYFFFVIILGVSYAYFSTTLRITGVASIDGYVWPEGVLPSVPVKTQEGLMISNNFKSEYISGSDIPSDAQDRFDNVSEVYDAATSTYTLTIEKNYKFGQSWDRKGDDFDLNFTIENYGNVTWTNGEVSTSYDSNGDLLSDVSGTLDKVTLASRDKATLNMKFNLVIQGTFVGTSYTDTITYKINYLVNNEVKTTTVIVNFICS